MPVHEFAFAILLQHRDYDTFLAEALLFPEVSRFGDEYLSGKKPRCDQERLEAIDDPEPKPNELNAVR